MQLPQLNKLTKLKAAQTAQRNSQNSIQLTQLSRQNTPQPCNLTQIFSHVGPMYLGTLFRFEEKVDRYKQSWKGFMSLNKNPVPWGKNPGHNLNFEEKNPSRNLEDDKLSKEGEGFFRIFVFNTAS